MLKFLAEKISTHLLSMLVIAVTPALAAVAIFFRTEITNQIQAEPQTLAILLVVLALGCLALFAWVFYLLPSFKYLPKYQFYQHRVNGLYYCPTCRNKKPLSPLRYENTGWRCPFKECSKFYKDPDYKKPESPAQQDLGPHGWMSR
jgi:hypothetical protein